MVKTWKTSLIRGINVTYLVIALLFITDCFQVLEVKTASLKNFVHFGTIISTLIVLFINTIFLTHKKWLISIGLMALMVCITLGIVISQRGTLGYLFSTSDWNTQTVIYQHTYQYNRTIERQMKDVGALGYRERRVEVFYITPWLMITREYDGDPNDQSWVEINDFVDEIGFGENVSL